MTKLAAVSNLRNLPGYLGRYERKQQPGAFEFLVSSVFARSFHLPLQNADTEDATVEHRVIWHGRVDSQRRIFSPASHGPDGVCLACGYSMLIEGTLRGNVSSQWRKEFVECLSHYDEFLQRRNVERNDAYLALVAPQFHQSTYTGFKQKALEGYNVVMLECESLAKICIISDGIRTLRQLDLRHLIKGLVRELRQSGSLASFRGDVGRCIAEWEVEMLKQERTVYFGLKSYEVMKRAGTDIVGVSDIMLGLNKDRQFERYLRKLGGGDLAEYVREGLVRERLARIVEAPSEDLFCKVEGADFRGRGLRLIRAVEEIDR